MSKQTLFRQQRKTEYFHKYTTSLARCRKDKLNYRKVHNYVPTFFANLFMKPPVAPGIVRIIVPDFKTPEKTNKITH